MNKNTVNLCKEFCFFVSRWIIASFSSMGIKIIACNDWLRIETMQLMEINEIKNEALKTI